MRYLKAMGQKGHYHQLKKPCKNCPFLKEGAIELVEGRLQGIVSDLLESDFNTFSCHKTTRLLVNSDNECDDVPEVSKMDSKVRMCAGAAIYLLKKQRPTVSMRLAYSFGMLDFDALLAQANIVIDDS